MRVVVAGQLPPPIGGQNICVKRLLDLLGEAPGIRAEFLRMEFTRSWAKARKFDSHKFTEFLRVLGRLARIRRDGPIDCVVYPSGGPHTIAILRDMVLLPWVALASRKVILHFHAAGMAEKLGATNGFVRGLVTSGYRLFCDEAIVLTEFGRRDAEAMGLERVHLLPNATEDLAGGPIDRSTGGPVTLLNVGHLCADKGTPELLRAFGRLAAGHPDVRLRLVGEPIAPYTEADLRRDIGDTGAGERVSWAGALQGEALADAYRSADLFVFATVAPYESFGLVMVEAMHWSLPLVVTDWRANRFVATGEFGGILAELRDPAPADALESAIGTALAQRDRWAAWGRTNRGIYEQRYSLGTFRRNVLALLGAAGTGSEEISSSSSA